MVQIRWLPALHSAFGAEPSEGVASVAYGGM